MRRLAALIQTFESKAIKLAIIHIEGINKLLFSPIMNAWPSCSVNGGREISGFVTLEKMDGRTSNFEVFSVSKMFGIFLEAALPFRVFV